MNKKYLKNLGVLIFTISFTLSCTTKVDIHFGVPHKIQIKPEYFKDQMFNFINLIDSVHYVKLETNDNCLFGTINKIKIINDTIYLGDMNNTKAIYAFSLTGKFLYKISKVGKGPGEYVYPVDFGILNKHIVIYDDKLCKLLFFTKEGKFEVEKPVKVFLGTTFTGLQNDILAFNSCGIENNTHELIVTDCEGKTLEMHFKIEDWMKKILYTNPGCFSTDDSNCFFIPTHNDTIYKLNGTTPEPYLNIDFGKLTLTKDAITEKSKTNDKHFISVDDFATISRFYNTKDYSILSFSYKKDLKLALIKNPDTLIIVGSGVISTEDTDYLPFWPIASYKNKFVSIIYSNNVIYALQNHTKNIDMKKTKIYQQLGNDLLNFKDTDNPIIAIYSLKNKIIHSKSK
jgi:hypothetical protein